ncbi:MAG: Alkaline shock protein [Firmicutes bacterium]|nr:Alkaline shock protein [Bacillota bacterium]
MSENREYITCNEEHGDIYISEEVVAMIAGAAVLEVEGVAGLAGANLGEQILGKKTYARGVIIQREDERMVLNVSIMIHYGYAVPDLARKVQEAVISAVEATSGLGVKTVNVRVGGVVFNKQDKQIKP